MGKVQMGILDGFVGKVGTVVGSFWKGKPVMRAYKRAVADANTNAQQLIRTRFAALGALASAFYYAIAIGFKNVARSKKITEGDYFVKTNWRYSHADTPGSATIDFEELSISKGNLPNAGFVTATFTNPNEVAVAISDTSDYPGADTDDLAYIFVYSPEAGAGVLSAPKIRTDQEITCDVPSYWVGQRVHVYGFTVGSGADNKGITSDSLYLGSGTVN